MKSFEFILELILELIWDLLSGKCINAHDDRDDTTSQNSCVCD